MPKNKQYPDESDKDFKDRQQQQTLAKADTLTVDEYLHGSEVPNSEAVLERGASYYNNQYERDQVLEDERKDKFKKEFIGDMTPRDIRTFKQKLYDLNIIKNASSVNSEWDDETGAAFEVYYVLRTHGFDDKDIFRYQTNHTDADSLIDRDDFEPEPQHPSERLKGSGMLGKLPDRFPLPEESERMRGSGWFGKDEQGNLRTPVKDIVETISDWWKK